jgi:protein-disulfide isomerase
MHDRLFESRARWAAAATPDSLLRELAAAAGADRQRYDDCMQSGRTRDKVASSIAEGQKLGFNGTPSFRFTLTAGGDTFTFSGAHPIEKFSEWIDAMLAGNAPPAPASPPEPKMGKLPFWASPEGLAPGPARPGFTMAGDAHKGDPKAALVVVEFSDFQCPSCQRHALDTEPVLDARFIATGRVYWVFKNLPLAIHANAPAAAAAAECAGGQQKFWEMARLLFASSDKWSKGDPDAPIVALAMEAGLSVTDFRKCYEGRAAMERVLKDLYDSNNVATTTPTFILIQDGRGRVLTGAQKTENFGKIIEQALSPTAAQK